jgi:hypothetical protein
MSNYAAPSASEASLPKPDEALAALVRLLARQAAAEMLADGVVDDVAAAMPVEVAA